AIHRIMFMRAHVAYPADIRGQRLAAPPFAAQEKTQLRRQFSCAQKELLHTRLAVGQAVADEGQVAAEALFSGHGKMRVSVMRVVDGMAILRAQLRIVLHYCRAATVGEDKIVSRNQLPERISDV